MHEERIKELELLIENQRAALHIAKETLQKLAYWFDADEEFLETMSSLERADHERLVNLIRHTRKEIRRLTVNEKTNG